MDLLSRVYTLIWVSTIPGEVQLSPCWPFCHVYRNVGYGRETEELLILVTPRIVGNEEKVVKKPIMPRAEGGEEMSEPESQLQKGPQGKLEKLVEEYEKGFKAAADWLDVITNLFDRCGFDISLRTPNERMEALYRNSENYKQIKAEWARFWFTDQPAHMTVDRIHGGIE